MCLLIVASRVFPEAPLVMAGNRDERYDRPAEAMTVLREDPPRTIGGRDLAAGGTWLAANEHGVVAGLTNRPLPDGADPARRSRGALPLALTAGTAAGDTVARFLGEHDPADYNPAWLLVGDRESLHSIDLTGSSATSRALPPGVHVLENRPLGEPSAKLRHVRRLVQGIERLPLDEAVTVLERVLADHERQTVPPEELESLPEEHRATRLAATAACGHSEGYGTRWSGIVIVPADPSSTPAFRHTEDAPCRSAFVDAAGLWR